MTRITDWQVGQSIQLNDGRLAIIRFIGNLHFTAGEWIGVEFEDASGKNDGSAKGERYFECAQDHGMFLRPTMIARVVEQRSRSVPGLSGTTIAQPVRRYPSSGVSSSALSRSPTKSKTSQPFARGSSTDSNSYFNTKPSTNYSRQSSASSLSRSKLATVPQGSEVDRRGRSSIVHSSVPMRDGTRQMPLATSSITNRTAPTCASSVSNSVTGAQSYVTSNAGIATDHNLVEVSWPYYQRTQSTSNIIDTASPSDMPVSDVSRKSSDDPSSIHTETLLTQPITEQIAKQKSRGVAKLSKEVDELQIKLRLVEKKRQEDREKLKILDRLRQDKEKFEIVVQKLRAKYQPLQNELMEAKNQLSKADEKLQQLEKGRAEHDTAVEMATLDREMAEELADAYKSELEVIKNTLEETQLENDVLREENEELGKDMSPEERTNKGWLQMEKENERLRKALIRLRELTQEQDSELRRVISGLENDVSVLSGFKEQYEGNNTSLLQARVDIEDLRLRLDAALGAEEVIEELTDKNIVLVERIEELQATVEDLQSLKELSDELEINHMEHGKQLQETIDLKDEVIAEQSRKAVEQGNMLAEHEYITNRFRGLVNFLQSNLESMRMSKELTETEFQELNNRTRVAMDLNLKLQSSATKGQAKLIDVELKNLDAEQATDYLAMVQPFLPEDFSAEKGSFDTLLQFKRIRFKAKLIHAIMREKLYENHIPCDIDDFCALFTNLNILLKISSISDDFVHQISTCSTDELIGFNGLLHDLGPIEKVLSKNIEYIKRNDINTKKVSEELQRVITVLAHLSDNYVRNNAANNNFDALRRTYLLHDQLKEFISVLSLINSYAEARIPKDGGCVNKTFTQGLTMVISNLRSSKTAIDNIIKFLQELISRSLSLTCHYQSILQNCEHTTDQIFDSAQNIGSILLSSFSVDENDLSPGHQQHDYSSKTSPDLVNSISVSSLLREIESLNNDLTELVDLSRGNNCTTEISCSQPPWILRAKRLHELKSVPAAAEDELGHLRNTVRDAVSKLISRETALEDANVKIELLESRAKDSSVKISRIDELEKAIKEYSLKADRLTAAVNGYKADIATLAAERDQLQRTIELQSKHDNRLKHEPGNGIHDPALSVVQLQELSPLRAENHVLRAALTHFRKEIRHQSMFVPLSERCDNTSLDSFSRQFPLNTISSIRNLYNTDEMSESWLAAPLLFKRERSLRKTPSTKPIKATNASNPAYSEPITFPSPITLPRFSNPKSRLEWQPFHSTSLSLLIREEKKLAMWVQTWFDSSNDVCLE